MRLPFCKRRQPPRKPPPPAWTQEVHEDHSRTVTISQRRYVARQGYPEGMYPSSEPVVSLQRRAGQDGVSISLHRGWRTSPRVKPSVIVPLDELNGALRKLAEPIPE